MRISPRGDFVATLPGNFKITAEAAGKQAHIHMRVLDGIPHKRNEQPERTVDFSTGRGPQDRSVQTRPKGARDYSAHHATRTPQFVNASFKRPTAPALAAVLLPADCNDVYNWNACNYDRMENPGNRRGNPPSESP